MMLLLAVAALLAFLAGLLSVHMPFFACVVAWLCGVVTAIVFVWALIRALMREDYARWQRTRQG